jgi:hypothetical protein
MNRVTEFSLLEIQDGRLRPRGRRSYSNALQHNVPHSRPALCRPPDDSFPAQVRGVERLGGNVDGNRTWEQINWRAHCQLIGSMIPTNPSANAAILLTSPVMMTPPPERTAATTTVASTWS